MEIIGNTSAPDTCEHCGSTACEYDGAAQLGCADCGYDHAAEWIEAHTPMIHDIVADATASGHGSDDCTELVLDYVLGHSTTGALPSEDLAEQATALVHKLREIDAAYRRVPTVTLPESQYFRITVHEGGYCLTARVGSNDDLTYGYATASEPVDTALLVARGLQSLLAEGGPDDLQALLLDLQVLLVMVNAEGI